MRLRLRLRAARRLLPGAQRRLLRLRPAGAGDRRRQRQLRADRAQRRGRDRPPGPEVLGLQWLEPGDGGEAADTNGDGVTDPIETSLEWGVRSLGKRVSVNAEGDLPAEAVADVFPAYDDDGGLLLVLTPGGLDGDMGNAAPQPLRPALRPRAGRRLGAGHRDQADQLGLDLKGGVELVYQGRRPARSRRSAARTSNARSRSSASGSTARRLRARGLAPRHRPRSRSACPTSPTPQRAIDQVGTTAQLYFYDWEPNLIGREQAIGGRPGREPPAGPLKEAEEEWKEAGRDAESVENQQLIFSGAFPTAYGAATLAAEQEPVEDCTTCSTTKPRYYLFAKDSAARPDRRARRQVRRTSTSTPTGANAPRQGRRRSRSRPGTIVVSEQPQRRRSGQVDRGPPNRAGTRSRTIRRSRGPTSPTRSRNSTNSTSRTSPSTSPTTVARPSRT